MAVKIQSNLGNPIYCQISRLINSSLSQMMKSYAPDEGCGVTLHTRFYLQINPMHQIQCHGLPLCQSTSPCVTITAKHTPPNIYMPPKTYSGGRKGEGILIFMYGANLVPNAQESSTETRKRKFTFPCRL